MKQSISLSDTELGIVQRFVSQRREILNEDNPAYPAFTGANALQRRVIMQREHTKLLGLFMSTAADMLMIRGIVSCNSQNAEIYKETVMEYIKKIKSDRLIKEISASSECVTSHTLIQGRLGEPKNIENMVILCGFHAINYSKSFKLVRDSMTLKCETSIEILHGYDNSIILSTDIAQSR